MRQSSRGLVARQRHDQRMRNSTEPPNGPNPTLRKKTLLSWWALKPSGHRWAISRKDDSHPGRVRGGSNRICHRGTRAAFSPNSAWTMGRSCRSQVMISSARNSLSSTRRIKRYLRMLTTPNRSASRSGATDAVRGDRDVPRPCAAWPRGATGFRRGGAGSIYTDSGV